ncbi:heterokaryon incompatibility protein-domain-containing protein [Ilyonectria robusta]|uniref:heterokaryon incompatibility protein-domain-containing protein n=1 Tax=Ilyonectria robusta TaxID=1079257 RepID=UPI001E8E6867|nr:heterokaryon incompatibility protein-domain-containing protein [Ilyonectria robusta]KAH8656875.1 heterokaryon incompatibility protein-domain-containing protein [Ilyonectria robusta]
MEERYIYRPLDRDNGEIRLVKLEMSADDDDISCELLTVPLASAPPYEALSYTWGSPLNKHKISIDGTPFQVTGNLFAALQHLRNPTSLRENVPVRYQESHRLLWIDAICINQEDIDERNFQVRLMWHIYAIAGQVSVWLGEEADDSAVAMEMIRLLAKNYDIQDTYAPMHLLLMLHGSSFGNHTNPQDPSEWVAVQKLLERPWWRRVWVIQEVAASREHPVWVGCGESWLPWDAFMEAALGIENMKGHPFFERVNRLGEGTKWIIDKATLKVAPDGNQERRDNWGGLVNYLHLTRSYSATDPRDKVFALLGLVPRLGIIPDYKEPVEQVFGNLVRESIRATHSLMMLLLQRKPRRLTLPSWVPDLSTEIDGELADGNSWHNMGIGTVPCRLVEDDPPNQLTVSGFIYDKPLVLAETWTSGKDERQSSAYKVIQDYSKLLEETDAQHFPRKPGNHRQECFWRTLIWNATEGDRYPAPDTYEAGFQRFKGGNDVLINLSNPSTDAADHQKIAPADEGREFYNALVRHALNRRFFITTRGNLGSGPADMREGDHICVLLGSKVPVILRDVEERPGYYGYVGHAYVHGIMHGEALALLDSEADTDRDGSRWIGIRPICLI